MRRYSIRELVQRAFYTGMHRDGIRAMFWGVVLRTFAAATVGLFVPIYVYKIGHSFYGGTVEAGIRTLVIFLIISRLSVISTSVLVEQVIDRIGFRLTLLLSSFFLIIKYVLLEGAQSEILLLWLAAFASGAVTTTYWVSRHALIGEDQDATSIGSSLGMIIVLARVATIIGPIIGGFLAAYLGFDWLFNFGLILAVLSSIPYFFMKHHRRHHPDGISGLMDKIRDRQNLPLIYSWIGRSWDDTLSVEFWPLYIFIFLGSVGELGVISSLVATVSMIAAYISGRMFDRTSDKKKMYLAGAGITAIFWPLKALARGFWSIFGLDSAHSVVSSFYTIPLLSQTYRISFNRDTVAFFAFREIVFSVGILGFLLMVFLLTYYWNWAILFFFGTLGVLLSMNMVKYHNFR